MDHPRLFGSQGRLAILVSVALTLATTATAQVGPGPGGKVFGLVGGSFGDGETAVSISGGAGVRLTSQLGLDLEVVHVSRLDLSKTTSSSSHSRLHHRSTSNGRVV